MKTQEILDAMLDQSREMLESIKLRNKEVFLCHYEVFKALEFSLRLDEMSLEQIKFFNKVHTLVKDMKQSVVQYC